MSRADTDFEGEPSLSGLLENMVNGMFQDESFGNVDNPAAAISKMNDRNAAAIREEASVFYDTFKTEAGRKCLNILLDRTLRRSAWPAEMNFGMDVLTTIGIAREAQNSLVAAIIDACAKAQELETKSREQG